MMLGLWTKISGLIASLMTRLLTAITLVAVGKASQRRKQDAAVIEELERDAEIDAESLTPDDAFARLRALAEKQRDR